MLPLSSPSYAVAPPPRQSFPEIRQETVVYTPPAYTAPATTTAGICQIVPAGSVLYSDPPTITLSESGQVIEQTPMIFYPVGTTPGTVTAYQTQPFTTTTTTYPVASAPVMTTAAYDSQPFAATTLQPVEYSQTTTTYTPTVDYTQTVTYSEPVITTATYTMPVATTQTAVYYPDSSPVVTTSTFTPATPSVPFNGAALRLVPATDIPPGNHPNDALPSQWFEVIRPGDAPIRIGRVSSTCVCVSPRVPNRFVAQGERALIEARIVQRPTRNNLTYGIFVNVVEPVTQTVDSDITIRF
jgi:Predicted solute binding protein